MKKDSSLIPNGLYCYAIESIENYSIKIKLCPYWELKDDQPKQRNGYCHYLKCGDWEDEGTMFLFDQVKECGINIEDN